MTDVLGEVDFHFYSQWFDGIFVVSAVSSAAVLAIVSRIKNA